MGIVFTGKDCHPVALPGCLADWIDSHMPKLKGGVASVTIQCCDEVRVGFIFKGRRTGYTSGKNTIHIADCQHPVDPCDEEFVRRVVHELAHVIQWRRHGRSWRLRYVGRMIRAGFDANRGTAHRDERHAWQREDDLWKQYAKENPCDCPW